MKAEAVTKPLETHFVLSQQIAQEDLIWFVLNIWFISFWNIYFYLFMFSFLDRMHKLWSDNITGYL